MTTPRVALCLSGQPRFHNGKSYLSIKKFILDKYNVDVFIHSWVSKDKNFVYPVASWTGIKKLVIEENIHDELVQLYSPKKILIEEPRLFPEYDKGTYFTKNIPSIFFTMKMADKLRQEYEVQNNIKYDWVIRARTDTLLESFPEIEKLSKNKLYIPNGFPFHVYQDNFSICCGTLASHVYNIFDAIKEYPDTSPEIFWTCHLKRLNIVVERINFIQKFCRS
jgi:hypothetical protein